jgi:hypothetical protein
MGSRAGQHRLLFISGRVKNENEDRENDSMLKESEKFDDIVQVRIRLVITYTITFLLVGYLDR